MQNIYIIEHLEPRIWKWCFIEYKSISSIVGKENLWFTNIKTESKIAKELSKYGKTFKESVKTMNLDKACILDPESNIVLTEKDKNEFRYFIFGGILGDNPPRKRTEEELTRFIKEPTTRNIGKEQFSTDNAVFVTHEILSGTSLSKMKFQDEIEIQINDIESTILPYRYPVINGKPRIKEELVDFIKKKK